MFLKKASAIHYTVSAVLTVLLIFSFSMPVFSQRTETGKEEKKLTLTKDAKENGYRISQRGEGELYVSILGAVNPLTGKKFDGKHKFAYKCVQVAKIILITVVLVRGYVNQKIRCSPEYDPYLLY